MRLDDGICQQHPGDASRLVSRNLGIGGEAGPIERVDLQAGQRQVGATNQGLYLVDDGIALHTDEARDHLSLDTAVRRIQARRADLYHPRCRAIRTADREPCTAAAFNLSQVSQRVALQVYPSEAQVKSGQAGD